MRILFVSRAFPPTIGGIEKQNAEVAQFLGAKATLTLIANTRGKGFLPVFLPLALFKILFLAHRHDVLLLGDGVLAPLGAMAKIFFPRLAVISIVHGLDITFAEKPGFLARVYAAINIPSLKKLDGLIAVSRDTKERATSCGVSPERAFVIPNGIRPDFPLANYARPDLERVLGSPVSGRTVLLTAGRLIKRKGAAWFVENVMPRLPNTVLYVVAGAGPQADTLTELIKTHGLIDRVRLLGRVSDEELQVLLETADVFVQPNIRVAGDMEGFGIAVIEAAAARRPVVASRLEGLQDAIADGENGLFAEPEHPQSFVEKINWLLADETRRHQFGEKARAYTLEHYGWDRLSDHYLELLEDIRKSVISTH